MSFTRSLGCRRALEFQDVVRPMLSAFPAFPSMQAGADHPRQPTLFSFLKARIAFSEPYRRLMEGGLTVMGSLKKASGCGLGGL